LSKEQIEKRGLVFVFILTFAFLVLVGRLAYLQVLHGEEALVKAETQKIRKLTVPAPRGKITDANGVVLATNRPTYVASLVWTKEPMSDNSKELLAEILDIEISVIDDARRRLTANPFTPVTLKVDVSAEEHTRLKERGPELPGVIVEPIPVREYPNGSLASHVLGYVLSGSRAGLENTYNDRWIDDQGNEQLGLEGINGERLVEVDVKGRPTKIYGQVDPVPGNNLVLTIDAALQETAEKALERTILQHQKGESFWGFPMQKTFEFAQTGAVVALDPNTGAILAMASYPDFDPNQFAIAPYVLKDSPQQKEWIEYYQSLERNQETTPLLNKAIQGTYAPGSTFKMVTSFAALEAGVSPRETVNSSGSFTYYGQTYGDWAVHGTTDMKKALGRSSSVYYYVMGLRAGIEAIEDWAYRFGLGKPSGLTDLTGERIGTVAGPISKARIMPEEPWQSGETLSAAIGQSFNAFTPLQMANYTAMIANGGIRYKPYLVQEIRDADDNLLESTEPEIMDQIDFDPDHLEVVREGMLSVTTVNNQPYGPWAGTASFVFGGERTIYRDGGDELIQVAGKTGTAETWRTTVYRDSRYNHGWFVAYAPYDNPEIAIAVFVENGGSGAGAAAPVAWAVMSEYFNTNKDLLDRYLNPVEGEE